MLLSLTTIRSTLFASKGEGTQQAVNDLCRHYSEKRPWHLEWKGIFGSNLLISKEKKQKKFRCSKRIYIFLVKKKQKRQKFDSLTFPSRMHAFQWQFETS